jgi:Na+/H+-dicarboxylate symporter
MFKINKTNTILIIICVAVFIGIYMACNSGQGMMHGGRWTTFIINLNWEQIIIGIGLGFLLGYFIFRKKK